MRKTYILKCIISAILINFCFLSCQNGINNKGKVQKSDTQVKKTDNKEYYIKRLNNILKISELDRSIKAYPRFDVIILQKSKCGSCDSSIYSYIKNYARSTREKLVLLVVNHDDTDWNKELEHDPAIRKIRIVEISDEKAQELGLSFVETVHVFFAGRQVKSYKVL